MTYEVGSVTIQGEQPTNVIQAVFGRKTTDGGKERILRKRDNYKMRIPSAPITDHRDDLMMDHADPSDMPSDSPFHAPDHDAS